MMMRQINSLASKGWEMQFYHVKGHNDIAINEHADLLAEYGKFFMIAF